jgi:hypothetical protein
MGFINAIARLSLFAAILLSCGNGGKSKGGQQAATGGESPPATQSGLTELTGSVFVDSSDQPAESYIIALIDHTDLVVEEEALGSDGIFSFPLTKFVGDHIYSLELLSDNRIRVDDFDLLPAITGDQNGFTYTPGGEGSDLGFSIVRTDGFGTIDREATVIGGYISGGFTAIEGAYGAADLSMPAGVSSVLLGSTLHPTSTNQILESFYLNGNFPKKYAGALSETSGIVLRVKGKGSDKLLASRVSMGPAWISGARKIATETGLPESWSKDNFEIPTITDYSAEANVLTGGVVDEMSSLAIEIQIADKDPIFVNRMLDHVIVLPPKVDTISLNSGSEIAIDYESTTSENGLSRPFLWSAGSVRLGVHVPMTASGAALRSDTLTKATIDFTYYSINEAGDLNKASISRSDYADPFDQAGGIGTDASVRRSWNPDNFQMSYALDVAAVQGLDTIGLLIDSNALLFTKESVDRVKAVITMKGDIDETSTIVWFKK